MISSPTAHRWMLPCCCMVTYGDLSLRGGYLEIDAPVALPIPERGAKKALVHV